MPGDAVHVLFQPLTVAHCLALSVWISEARQSPVPVSGWSPEVKEDLQLSPARIKCLCKSIPCEGRAYYTRNLYLQNSTSGVPSTDKSIKEQNAKKACVPGLERFEHDHHLMYIPHFLVQVRRRPSTLSRPNVQKKDNSRRKQGHLQSRL